MRVQCLLCAQGAGPLTRTANGWRLACPTCGTFEFDTPFGQLVARARATDPEDAARRLLPLAELNRRAADAGAPLEFVSAGLPVGEFRVVGADPFETSALRRELNHSRAGAPRGSDCAAAEAMRRQRPARDNPANQSRPLRSALHEP